MSKTLKVTSRRLKSAFAAWSSDGLRGTRAAGRVQVGLFVRDVIRITPPNTGRMNKAAGTKRIRRELTGIMREANSTDFADVAENPASIHRQFRTSSGRVYKRLVSEKKDSRYPVHNLKAYIAQVQSKVGLLASGWLAAAQSLGVPVPNWISRHGAGLGQFREIVGLTGIRLRVVNRVPFVNNVRDLLRRCNAAADNRAAQMEKQTANFLFRTSPRRSGFKVKDAA